MSKKEENLLEWLLDSNNAVPFDEVKVGPGYGTPDWVRHPERYPELMERLRETAQELWPEGWGSKK